MGILGPPKLHSLPYDLLLNIALRLDLLDIHNLHLTCRALYGFSISRPVYRQIANDLLRRSRALPLKGFQQITDLSTQQLIRAVNKAARYEYAWQHRGPRPICGGSYKDGVEGTVRNSKSWYKIVSAPPNEEVDWLSPITSSYTLCSTKTGKVVCWDVQTDRRLAEWSLGERWELWKCRVEFEEKTVYFTMAKVIVPRNDDTRIMEFVLMRLRFFDGSTGESADTLPVFEHVTKFKTRGVVMNIFLLDPIARLLSAFIYANGTNTICLYALLDWDKPQYIFIDTGIECVLSSNWSCILYERNIVIHCEESHGAFQYFYPLHLLEVFAKKMDSKSEIPRISYRVSPAVTLHRKFIFPILQNNLHAELVGPIPSPTTNGTHGVGATNGFVAPTLSISSSSATPPLSPSTSSGSEASTSSSPPPTPSLSAGPSAPLSPPNPNPYPFPLWSPDSAHFVRQWWPSLPGIPRVSCTVVLLAAHDPETHHTRFMLAQHYFRVPLTQGEWDPNVVSELTHKLVGPEHSLRPPGEREGAEVGVKDKGKGESHSWRREDGEQEVDDAALMHLWYVDTPFEVVCVAETTEEPEDEDNDGDRPRPLVAVDFGHAAWIEFVDNEDDPTRPRSEDSDAKWLRFVTFPPFNESLGKVSEGDKPWSKTGGIVRTLETPPDLDLDVVETINIDQSQGAVILSVRDGKIFILCYE
ncbi:hypothetical protein H2248_004264 [Termitomyces sp. 'cryptogamus']|nr:hypothetical protein H2248_004264 [Termitomyces sp. 'cryptogamus']